MGLQWHQVAMCSSCPKNSDADLFNTWTMSISAGIYLYIIICVLLFSVFNSNSTCWMILDCDHVYVCNQCNASVISPLSLQYFILSKFIHLNLSCLRHGILGSHSLSSLLGDYACVLMYIDWQKSRDQHMSWLPKFQNATIEGIGGRRGGWTVHALPRHVSCAHAVTDSAVNSFKKQKPFWRQITMSRLFLALTKSNHILHTIHIINKPERTCTSEYLFALVDLLFWMPTVDNNFADFQHSLFAIVYVNQDVKLLTLQKHRALTYLKRAACLVANVMTW